MKQKRRTIRRALRAFEPPPGASLSLRDRVRKVQRALRFDPQVRAWARRRDQRWQDIQ